MQIRIKEPLDESERGEWKSWFKTQHPKNRDYGVWFHYSMANRWGNNGNSERLYFQTFQSLSHVRLLATPWTIACQVPCPSPTPRAYLNSYPLNRWCHPTKSSAVISFSSCLQFSQHQGLFWWVSSLHQVAKLLEFQNQSFHWIFRTDFL